MAEPRYTRPALQDYLDIAEYIARDNRVAAAQLVDRIEMECAKITDNPDRGSQHNDLPGHLRVKQVARFLIIYRVDEAGVLILRIVHGARDLSQLFPE